MQFIKTSLTITLIAIVANINASSALATLVDFYGHKVRITFDKRLSSLRFYTYDQREIDIKLDYYRNANLTTSAYNLRKNKLYYQLDGAATTILADKYATKITKSKNSNQQVFVKYLMMKELGFDVILTKTGTKLNCLGNLSFTPGRYIFIRYICLYQQHLRMDPAVCFSASLGHQAMLA